MKFQVNEEIERIERTISESKAKKREGEEEEDALDAYMSSVSETTVTTGAVPENHDRIDNVFKFWDFTRSMQYIRSVLIFIKSHVVSR